nr:hypothetical protein [Candidatus Gracilibacteria bacterium]
MKVIIFGEGNDFNELKTKVTSSLEDLGLNDFIEVVESNSTDLKEELGITKNPALIIEEESIEFKDMIFEGVVPPEDEIKSMFISIIGGDSESSCSPGGCGSGCSCG